MIKFLFIVGVVTAAGIVNPATARQSDMNEPSDSTAVFQQWMESLPDTLITSVPADSLKSIFYNCIYNRFNVPIFEPDSDLTKSMPQLFPPKVDEKMIIPQLKYCREHSQPPQR